MKVTFRGLHNHHKSIALIILSQPGNNFITCKELSKRSGLALGTLPQLLLHWYKFGYIKRKAVEYDGKPVWAYAVTKKGERFLSRIPPTRLTEYLGEINKHRSNGGL